jgi:2'-5' RNA ligase
VSGFVLEERPFTAHVTLARDTRRAVGSLELPPIDWPVDDFVLVRSRPSPQGSRYEVIGRWNLADRVDG